MRKQRAERLRFAVESLPPETQRAMLTGIRENRIVTGANTDRRGGVCPMLAADRNAFAVTPLAEIFATAWDQYTGTSFVNVNRRAASERDLRVLQTMLETSLKLSARDELPAALAADPATPPPAAAELARTQATLTAAARIEIIRALEASGHHLPTPPAPRVVAAAPPAPAPARAAAPAPRQPVRREAPGHAARAAAAAPPAAATARRVRAAGADHRAPALKTDTELERQRARAIIANQASTLRSRAWPRPADPARPVDTVRPAEAARQLEAARQIAAGRPVEAARPAPAPTPVVRVGRPTRMQELAARSGWAWLPAFNSYDDYERTLQDLGETERGPGADDGGVRREDTKQPDRTPA
jgi:hypothetical protein